ncbi:unnamed protein product, partial [Choristocarpus tenellus]
NEKRRKKFFLGWDQVLGDVNYKLRSNSQTSTTSFVGSFLSMKMEAGIVLLVSCLSIHSVSSKLPVCRWGSGDGGTSKWTMGNSPSRGYMGTAMLDSPGLVVFAGGIGSGGRVVDGRVNAVLGMEGGLDSARSESLELDVPRTDIGTTATANALYFAGGCGITT